MSKPLAESLAQGPDDQSPVLQATRPAPPKKPLPWNFAEWFILSQTLLPALLYLPGSQPFRVPIRVASYGISLCALVYCYTADSKIKQRMRLAPASKWLIAVLLYLTLMVLHPTANTLAASVGQVGLYLAIMAPAFWAASFVESPERLRRLLWLMLICCGINSFVGVMQVRNPDFWMPREFSSVMMEGEFGMGTVIYEGADGRLIIRPPGLLDAPGAVAGPATFALFLGLVFAAESRKWGMKLLSFVFAVLGAAAIFFTLVRSNIIIAVGMVLVYLGLQVSQRQYGRAAQLAAVMTVAITLAFLQSLSVGGDSLLSRFQSLLVEDPLGFYYENRGNQVTAGFTELLPQYPLGAGLGRYGMMHSYFGDPNSASAPPIWVEIQWPAWIVDGGVVMLVLYPMALLLAIWKQGSAAWRHPDQEVRSLAGMVFASNLSLLALCFSYAVFLSPMGTQFWFFSGALYGISQTRRGPANGLSPARRAATRKLPAADSPEPDPTPDPSDDPVPDAHPSEPE